MSYTAATASTLKARFPAFRGVEDGVIESALTRARRMVDSTWLSDDRAEGEMLHAAHELTMDGHGSGAEAQAGASGTLGFKSMKSGSLSLERFDSANGSLFDKTTYGKRFHALMKRNAPAVKSV